jgi:hypothetical protein
MLLNLFMLLCENKFIPTIKWIIFIHALQRKPSRIDDGTFWKIKIEISNEKGLEKTTL